jgi:hypothetical protein
MTGAALQLGNIIRGLAVRCQDFGSVTGNQRRVNCVDDGGSSQEHSCRLRSKRMSCTTVLYSTVHFLNQAGSRNIVQTVLVPL